MEKIKTIGLVSGRRRDSACLFLGGIPDVSEDCPRNSRDGVKAFGEFALSKLAGGYKLEIFKPKLFKKLFGHDDKVTLSLNEKGEVWAFSNGDELQIGIGDAIPLNMCFYSKEKIGEFPINQELRYSIS